MSDPWHQCHRLPLFQTIILTRLRLQKSVRCWAILKKSVTKCNETVDGDYRFDDYLRPRCLRRTEFKFADEAKIGLAFGGGGGYRVAAIGRNGLSAGATAVADAA